MKKTYKTPPKIKTCKKKPDRRRSRERDVFSFLRVNMNCHYLGITKFALNL